jgi:hypothetical protein
MLTNIHYKNGCKFARCLSGVDFTNLGAPIKKTLAHGFGKKLVVQFHRKLGQNLPKLFAVRQTSFAKSFSFCLRYKFGQKC